MGIFRSSLTQVYLFFPVILVQFIQACTVDVESLRRGIISSHRFSRVLIAQTALLRVLSVAQACAYSTVY